MIKKVKKKNDNLTEAQIYQKVLAGSADQVELMHENITMRAYNSELKSCDSTKVVLTKEQIQNKMATFCIYMNGQDFEITVDSKDFEELGKFVDTAVTKAEAIAKTDVEKFFKDNELVMTSKQKRKMQERYAEQLLQRFLTPYY